MGKTAKTIIAISGILFVTPIWYFLMYTILEAIQPDRLVWFLFWVYIPLSLTIGIAGEIAGKE